VTRAKISEYSATANDNTDVNGVNIAEGCPPSSMNNMGREIMAALKRFQVGSDGDGVTVGGALVVSGATTANTFSATAVNATGTVTFSGSVILSGTTTANTFSTDLITEKTSAAGVTIDGVLLKDTGVGSAASPVTLNSLAYPTEGSVNFRNRIINGDMRIDQRNAGAAVTINSATDTYFVDRFLAVGQSSDGVFTVQQSTTAPAGFVNSIIATVTTVDASIGSTQFYLLQHRIEGNNVADLGFGTANAKTVTLSFWVRSSLTGTFGGSLRNTAANRSYPFTYSISVADTWEQKSITIPGDTTGTWSTNNGIGITISFSLGDGSNRLGTAGAWAGANYSGATGQVQVIGTLNATWYITGVQLEVGSVATPFERRPFGAELALCQRYACSTFQQGVAWGQNRGQPGLYVLTQSTSARVSATFKFPVSMRATPTIVSYNPSRADSGWENLSTDVNVAATIAGVTDGLTTESAVVRTTNAASAINNALVIHLSASAEL